jgi:hypothetical protein
LSELKSNSIEHDLKEIVRTHRIPPDLSIAYDDMHGLWGGTTIVIKAMGNREILERSRGDVKPQIVTTRVDESWLYDLIELLIDIEAWKQLTPERQPVPDESKAMLRISVNGHTSEIWEWFNEMPKNQRLIRIKMKLRG